MMAMASKGHFFTQIPQPIHRVSEMKAICKDKQGQRWGEDGGGGVENGVAKEYGKCGGEVSSFLWNYRPAEKLRVQNSEAGPLFPLSSRGAQHGEPRQVVAGIEHPAHSKRIAS